MLGRLMCVNQLKLLWIRWCRMFPCSRCPTFRLDTRLRHRAGSAQGLAHSQQRHPPPAVVAVTTLPTSRVGNDKFALMYCVFVSQVFVHAFFLRSCNNMLYMQLCKGY